MSSIAPSDEMHTSGRIFDQSHSFRDRCVSLLVVLYSHFNVCYVTGLTLWDQPPQTRSPRFSRGILITPQILPRVVPTSLQPPTANSSPKCGAGSLTGRRWYNLPPRQPALKVPIRLHSVMCTDLQALRCPLRPPPGPSRAASHDPHLRPRPRPILSLPLPPTFNTTVMHTSRTITCHKSSYITSTSSKRCSTSLRSAVCRIKPSSSRAPHWSRRPCSARHTAQPTETPRCRTTPTTTLTTLLLLSPTTPSPRRPVPERAVSCRTARTTTPIATSHRTTTSSPHLYPLNPHSQQVVTWGGLRAILHPRPQQRPSPLRPHHQRPAAESPLSTRRSA